MRNKILTCKNFDINMHDNMVFNIFPLNMLIVKVKPVRLTANVHVCEFQHTCRFTCCILYLDNKSFFPVTYLLKEQIG